MDKKARKLKVKRKMSSAASLFFRMLARNNALELMAVKNKKCTNALVAAALDISNELSIKEVLLKPKIPDLGNGDLGLFPSCANSELKWFCPKYKRTKPNDEASQEWQYEPKETDEVEFLGVEKKRKENLSLMDIWMDSEDHAELYRLNDMLTPDIEIVWEGKATPGLPDEKLANQTGHDTNQVIAQTQGTTQRVEINRKVVGAAYHGQSSVRRTVVHLPQIRRSTRNLRSNLRFLPRLSVTSSQKISRR